MNFVRQSKFRHVFCKPLRMEFCLQDIRITKISWDSLFCAVNPKFLAVIIEGAGGPFMVVPVTKTGRIDKDFPIVDAHKAPCLEIAWCPFNDNVIASCSEDCTAKVWHIPEKGLNRNLNEPVVELLGHQRRVNTVLWHPSANNILLTAGADLKIFLWNVGNGEALIEIAGHPDLVWSVSFNYNGSKIVTTCKDKKIRVIDPRSGKILQQGVGHEGMKPQRAIYLRDGRIFSTGFTKRSERMYSLRDEEALEEPIIQEELDTSNGVLYPLYDVDSGLLYLAGKGDSAIRYYEVNNDPPFVHYINTYSSSEPQRGIGFMPKRGCNIMENEISRIYKCTNKGVVEVLPFNVPRKSELFQEDLYPDTAGPTPALTAEDWMNGKDADPILISLNPNPGGGPGTGVVKTVKKANILAQMAPTPAPTAAAPSPMTAPSPKTDASPKSSPNPLMTAKAETPKSAAVGATISLSSTNATPGRPKSPKDMGVFDPSPQLTPAQQALHELRKTPNSVRDHRAEEMNQMAARSQQRAEQREEKRAQAQAGGGGGGGGGATSGLEMNGGSHNYTNERASSRSSRVDDDGYGGGLAPPSRGSSRQSSFEMGPPTGRSALSPRSSLTGYDVNLEEIASDMQKLKAVVRRHERRIRFLEEQLAEKDLMDVETL